VRYREYIGRSLRRRYELSESSGGGGGGGGGGRPVAYSEGEKTHYCNTIINQTN